MDYINYDDYELLYDQTQHKFDVIYKGNPIVKDVCISGLYLNGTQVGQLSDFESFVMKREPSFNYPHGFALHLKAKRKKDDEADAFSFLFVIGATGIFMKTRVYDVMVTGTVCNGAESPNDVFPVCLDRSAKDLRSALGEAITNVDNALYNKMTDTAVVVGQSRRTKLSYDWEKEQYTFTLPLYATEEYETTLISVQENVLADSFHIKFSPFNRKSTFATPPMGWMTWYAVKFNACEEVVLKNARFQAVHLKDFGANAIWVDWEWYHEKFPGDRTDGVNSLMPDPKKYPNGMKYLADQIRALGLTPCLWIGFTNEPAKNEFIEKYPDMVLVDKVTWCGRYYYDYTNPHYLNEYLPAAVENVHKWGYDAVKFDTLPISLGIQNENREKMYDQSITVKEAYRNMVKKVRELCGKDMYMLSCAGANHPSVTWASDIFDAARIGDDIFTWQNHLRNVKRIGEFYPLHNIQLHADPDNVVLRSEFNYFEQAQARVTIVSLLGLPMTFGDDFEALSESRVDLLKRCLPILDIHPMDLNLAGLNDEDFLINLAIAKPYESYQVTGAYNLLPHDATRTLSLSDDLHLADGDYLVYDFFRDQFLGIVSGTLTLDFIRFEGRILSFRPYLGRPQIISTSRHITQGAAEITDMAFADNTLSFTADLVGKDSYTVSVYVPDGYRMVSQEGFESYIQQGNLLRLTLLPQQTQSYSFEIRFA